MKSLYLGLPSRTRHKACNLVGGLPPGEPPIGVARIHASLPSINLEKYKVS